MAHNPSALRSPKAIADEANRIYDNISDKISDKIKHEHKGQFMVVEVKTGKYFIHEAAGDAFQKGAESGSARSLSLDPNRFSNCLQGQSDCEP